MGGAELEASSQLSLKPGQVVTLKVEEIYPRVLLRVVAPESAELEGVLARALASLAGPAVHLGRMVEKVMALEPRDWGEEAQQALARAKQQLRQAVVEQGRGVGEVVEALGLSLERSLAKATAPHGARAALARVLEVAPPGPEKQAVRSLCGLLEAVATVCGGMQALEGKGVIVVPVHSGGVMELEGGREGRVGVWLSLGGSQAGARMQVRSRQVELELFVPQMDLLQAMKASLPGLSAALRARGMELEVSTSLAEPWRVIEQLLMRYSRVVSLKV